MSGRDSNQGHKHSAVHLSGKDPTPGSSQSAPHFSAREPQPGPSHSGFHSNPGPSHGAPHFSAREPQPGPSHSGVNSNPGPSHAVPNFPAKDLQPGHSNSELPKHIKEARATRAKRQIYKDPKYSLWPLDVGTQQKSLLSYLTALGQYQELLMHAFECDALDLIFYYINPKVQKDPVLALRGCEVS